jgi:heme A synthase
MYMGICTLDMAIFPVLWAMLQMFQNTSITQWQPLTLQGAGLFHIAMGAVLGIAAFGRT